MAYDEALASRIRARLADRPGLSEKEMFGGIAFLINGNMAVGVSRDELMVRVGKDSHDEAMSQPGTRVFDLSSRPMQGWVLVSGEGYPTDEDLAAWIDRGVSFAEGLKPK